MSSVVLPWEIFRIIVTFCHPLDGRKIRQSNKKLSRVVTLQDLVWGEANWRFRQSEANCWKWAAQNGHVEVVRWCVEVRGVDVHLENNHALRISAVNGHLNVVKLLLEKGSTDKEVLQLAATKGRLQVVRLLLDEGADVNALGGKALRHAASSGHVDVVKLLLERGANHQGGTILYVAASEGRVDMVRYLLENMVGKDVDEFEWPISHSLHRAAQNGHVDVVRLLLNFVADMHYDPDEIVRARDGVMRVARSCGQASVIRMLLWKDAKADADGDRGLAAAAARRLAVISWLLENGLANANDLANVAAEGHLEALRLFLEKGVAPDDLTEALCSAASYGLLEVVDLLLDYGADVHARDEQALRYAASEGHLDVVRLLLEEGADVHACADAALQLAKSKRHGEVVRLLREHGARMPKASEDEKCWESCDWEDDESPSDYEEESTDEVECRESCDWEDEESPWEDEESTDEESTDEESTDEVE
ncbi:hypothetical protein HK104_008608 [Borealophlyctis nickersoniae]|nr:hypothetical protein HK104_008608 [Borealophlyctis nickersoniae]